MKTTKDVVATGKPKEGAVDEIARTVKLATQACDGHQLSDRELEDLCDAVLILEPAERQTTLKQRN